MLLMNELKIFIIILVATQIKKYLNFPIILAHTNSYE